MTQSNTNVVNVDCTATIKQLQLSNKTLFSLLTETILAQFNRCLLTEASTKPKSK